MEYVNLTLGIILLIVFVFILQKNSKRNGFLNALFLDTFLGIVAGLYLLITAILSLLS